jgi:hypothetical protein
MDKEIKKGLQFISVFSLPPNSLGYCGKNSAAEKFKLCIVEGRTSGIKSEIIKFPVLNPYLNTISKISKSDKYSYKVAESILAR